MSLNRLFSCQECTTSSADLTKVSASIIVNLPCQERVFSAGQRLPHVIREDQKVCRGTAEIQQSQMESYTLLRHGTWTSGITSATRSKHAENRADKVICILHSMQRMLQIVVLGCCCFFWIIFLLYTTISQAYILIHLIYILYCMCDPVPTFLRFLYSLQLENMLK